MINGFIGEFKHNIDAKGRLMMPAKFRDSLGETFYVTKGMENCLFVFNALEFEALAEKINSSGLLSRKESRGFARLFYAGAIETELDKQGRILLPQNLRTYAGIEKEVYLIGVSKRIEIWNKDAWEDYSDDDVLNYDNLSDAIVELNL